MVLTLFVIPALYTLLKPAGPVPLPPIRCLPRESRCGRLLDDCVGRRGML